MKLTDLKVASYILYSPDFVHPLDRASFTVKLESRSQIDGSDKWGIFKSGLVLYKSEKAFGYEGMPSSRTDDTLSNTRFDSAQDALDFWISMEPEYDANLRADIKARMKPKQ